MTNGWSKWENHVLKEIKRLETAHLATLAQVSKVREDIAGLKVKSGVWGIIGGTIPIVIVLAFWIIKSFSG